MLHPDSFACAVSYRILDIQFSEVSSKELIVGSISEKTAAGQESAAKEDSPQGEIP